MFARFHPISSRGGILLLALFFALPVHGKTLHADNTLSGNCLTGYNVTSRSCSGGSATAYRTLTEAVAALLAGDTLLVRGGNYSERLAPPRSGDSSAYITIKAYPGETATITGNLDLGISLTGRSYLIIDGLKIDNVVGWGRLEDSNNNIIQNNRFTRATAGGTTGGLKLVRSNNNKILNNTFEDGNDNVVVQESDRNLIQDNIFYRGRHSLLSVRCSNYNIMRRNSFSNPDQKAAEIYDCEGTSDAPIKLDATKRNLFEANVFTLTLGSGQNYRYNGIQYSGQNGIVRHNVFYDNQGGALNFQVYSDEALYNYGHRVYNNTFYNNRCHGLAASANSSPSRYYDNRVKNNLLYKNLGCNGESAQTDIGNTTAVIMENNAIVSTSPSFVNETTRDLHLKQGSSMIDAGVPLTQTSSAGSGTQMAVDDVGYFSDGLGIAGEAGDLIQLSGQTQTARITAINTATKTLTLSQPLTWTNRQGVQLIYSGTSPDMGAYEYQTGSTVVTPSPPTNLQAAAAQ